MPWPERPGVAEAAGLEGLLRRERAIVAASLAALAGLAWTYLLLGAGMTSSVWEMAGLSLFPHRAAASAGMDMAGMDMAGMDMAGMGMPGEAAAPPWEPRAWLLAVAMWWTMMVAMMVAAAAPMILLYGRVRRHALSQGQVGEGRAGEGRVGDGLAPSAVFTAGYLCAWLVFSIVAATLQTMLAASGLMSAGAMSSASRWLSAGVLIAAGLYQFSPLKASCLAQCRAPAAFLSRHWRPGAGGALRLGMLHGAYCVGCCWVLMALLFVVGVMNLVWIAVLALLVMAEKLAPAGPWAARATGALLIAWGLATIAV